MNSKTKLKTFFDSKQEDAQYIEKYEENIDFFNNLLKVGHKEDIEFVIPIKMYSYVDKLIETGNYKKALSVSKEIENDLEKIKGQSKWYNQYVDGVTFFKGVCLGRLKKYQESNKEFTTLLIKKPTNDRFIDWYKSNKKNEIEQIFSFITIIGFSLYLIIATIQLTGHRIESLFLREIGLVTAILSFVLSYVWRKIIDKQKIKLKEKTTT